jgi:uncharacterized protein
MRAQADIRFMVDHMVIKLGKYLRILGYDAAWDPALRTHELILRANAEARVFVTRNKHLPYQYPAPARVLVLPSTDPAEQLRQVVARFALDPRGLLFTKCIRCNVLLEPVADKREIEARVHPNVFARFEQFFRCPSCGTVFWKGSHVRNTCRKLGLEEAQR